MRRLIAASRNFAIAIAAVAAFFALQGFFDYQDKLFADRVAYRQWVDDTCLPRHAGEIAQARITAEARLHCTRIGNTGYGKAPRIISAAVMELP